MSMFDELFDIFKLENRESQESQISHWNDRHVPKYIADMTWSQDSNQSLTKNGSYDLKNFSKHEIDTIKHVLKIVKQKYPKSYRSLGLANESSIIKYKPRYILYELIILKYGQSDNFIDKFAVALAYESKGAAYRKDAIKYFEESEKHVSPKIMNNFISYMPLCVYTMFAKLYEQEHDFDKAIYYTKIAKNYGDSDNPYFDTHINELSQKKKKVVSKRTRKISAERIEFEKDVTNSAKLFLKYITD